MSRPTNNWRFDSIRAEILNMTEAELRLNCQSYGIEIEGRSIPELEFDLLDKMFWGCTEKKYNETDY